MSVFNNIKEGDTFEAVSDGKGGFNFKPKGGSDGGGGGLFVLVFIVVALLIAVICLPLVLALYALMLDDYSARKTRKLALIISVVLILAYFIGQQIESVKPIVDVILSYKRLFSIGLVLNTIGVVSALVGLIKGIPNKFNSLCTISSVIGCLGVAIYRFGGDMFDKSEVAAYTKEQLNMACECYENSYSNKPIAYDNMRSRDQKMRTKCFELFKPKDYEIGDNVDTLMKQACDQQRSE